MYNYADIAVRLWPCLNFSIIHCRNKGSMAAVDGLTIPVQPFTNGHSQGYTPPIDLGPKEKVTVEVKTTPTSEPISIPESGPVPASKPVFQLEEHPIDEVKPIKVGVIGAGLTGVTAGVLLPAKVPGLDLRIYDKNADVVRSYTTMNGP